MVKTEPRKTIKTTTTAFDIIEAIHENGPCSLSKITEEVNKSKSTVHTHLDTLEYRGYVISDGDTYRLGLRFLMLGGNVRKSRMYGRLYPIAKQEIDEIVEETSERSQIMVEEQGSGFYLYQAQGSEAVHADTYAGAKVSLHSTAVGKAYLAHLPKEEVDDIIDELGLPHLTDNTLTDRDALHSRLEEIRERGVAFDRGERVSGVYCVAAPVNTDHDEILGAVSISIPEKRNTEEYFQQQLPDIVRKAARVIGLNTTYS